MIRPDVGLGNTQNFQLVLEVQAVLGTMPSNFVIWLMPDTYENQGSPQYSVLGMPVIFLANPRHFY